MNTLAKGKGDMVKVLKEKRDFLPSSEIVVLMLLIFIVSYLAYGTFHVKAIYSDDWDHVIERPVTENAEWLDVTDRRPLLFAPFLLQNELFGANVTAYYIVLRTLHIGLAVLVYLIANRFTILRQYSLSIVMALIFLVYPTIYTHTWLTTLTAYVTAGFTLLSGYLLLLYAERGRTVTLVVALLLLLASLGIYEAQLGIVCFWSLLLVVTHRDIPTMRRLGLLMPLLVAVSFMLYRTLGQQLVGVEDTYLSQVVISPLSLLDRFRLGYMISIFWGWSTTVRWFLPWPITNGHAILLIAVIVFVLWWIVRIIGYPGATQYDEGVDWPLVQRWPLIRSYAGVGLVGFLLIGAGYLPVATVVLPNLAGNGSSSRVNFFASFGGAVLLASVLIIGALLIAKSKQQVKTLFFTSAALFLLLGIVTQESVQYENRIAWREQQAIWQGLFSTAPNFKDDTFVLLVMPGFQERNSYQGWTRTPLHAFWDLSSGVKVLYDNATLSGDIVFPDLDIMVEPTLTGQGIVNQESGSLTPFEQSVVFLYDNESRTIEQLDELPAELVEGTVNAIKLCTDCVLEKPADVPLRSLVED